MNNERFEQLNNTFLPRFWDTENNVMVYPEMFIPNNEITFFIRYNIGKVLPEILTIDEMLSNPRFKEMRPTGLEDQNGKLIYEGDIVKDNLGGEYIIEWGISDYTLHGGFRNSGFIFFRIKKPDDLGICSGELEIIGNIHEKESK